MLELNIKDPPATPQCVKATPLRGHLSHDGRCIFSLSEEDIRLCAFGTDSGHPPSCPGCRKWSAKQRSAYSNLLFRLSESTKLKKPPCWSPVLNAVFQEDQEEELLVDQVGEASQEDLDGPQTTAEGADQHGPEQVQDGAAELLAQLELLQDPAIKSVFEQLRALKATNPQGQGSASVSPSMEEEDADRLKVLGWAKQWLPDMVQSSSSLTPGSFALQDSSWESYSLKGDMGVMGAFLKGLNTHRSIPYSAHLPNEISVALRSSDLVSEKKTQHATSMRPIKPKRFYFEDSDLASLLSKEALSLKNVVPHADWGPPIPPLPTAPHLWKRSTDGLALLLEASALVDILAAQEGEAVDPVKNRMFLNLRNSIISAASILGSFGHDSLMSRREQLLERYNLANKQSLLKEPFFPGQLLGPLASAAIQQGRDHSRTVSYYMSQLTKAHPAFQRGRPTFRNQSRPFRQQSRSFPHNSPGPSRNPSFRGRANRRSFGSRRGSGKRSASSPPPALQKKRF